MEEREYVELRSEEVQEILGTPPGWLVRWGTFVVFLCFAALIGVAAVISYPDVVEARVTITTTAPPVDVVARADGHITALFVTDKQEVLQGDVLGVIESTARYQDVLQLDQLVGAWLKIRQEDSLAQLTIPLSLELGEVQTDYSAFVQDLTSFQFGKEDKNSSIQQNIGSINRQISKLDKSIEVDRKAARQVQSQISTARERYQKQLELFKAGLISEVELEKARDAIDSLEQQAGALENSILRKQGEIISLKKARDDTSFSGLEGSSSSGSRLQQSLNTLRASIDKWKQTYLLTAPVDGKVSFHARLFAANQYVSQGEQVLTVVTPQKTDKVIGRLLLPIAGSGKVQPKQRVIIKLDSYPYYEYGTCRGTVISKSLVPKDNKYAILVFLPDTRPDTLLTSYNIGVPFEQQMQGTAEIITEEKQFLERIYEQVFAARR
ncbi:MAG: HlyD family efflux transporter periplasmic adaptor subunit [Bacteroidetes bacterium]|nr:MAG: HlyD family efflux transporter periplasmic adaptor subunit [Bacteroidota bacterium]